MCTPSTSKSLDQSWNGASYFSTTRKTIDIKLNITAIFKFNCSQLTLSISSVLWFTSLLEREIIKLYSLWCLSSLSWSKAELPWWNGLSHFVAIDMVSTSKRKSGLNIRKPFQLIAIHLKGNRLKNKYSSTLIWWTTIPTSQLSRWTTLCNLVTSFYSEQLSQSLHSFAYAATFSLSKPLKITLNIAKEFSLKFLWVSDNSWLC